MAEYLTREDYAPLLNKRITVGLTASSAIYRSIDLMRKLLRLGAELEVVMTRESTKFIGIDLVEWAVGKKPRVELTGRIEHVELANWSDLLVIAPATVKTLSKIVYGIADELLPLLAITMNGMNKKIAAVPTMNVSLYNSRAYRAIEERLKEHGIYVIPPLLEENRLKYPPLEDLAHCIDAIANRGRDLEGLRVLVTTGPTREYIDPVRVITNPSSGYMGVAISREASCRGSEVDLVHGPVSVQLPYMVSKHSVESTADMASAVHKLTENKKYDIAIFAAAPADYTVAARSSVKISSREHQVITINLRTTPRVVKHVSKRNRPSVIAIFAAETASSVEELVGKARDKLEEYDANLVVANSVKPGVGFSSKYIDACIVDESSYEYLGAVRKEHLARLLVDRIAALVGERKSEQQSR